MRKTVKNVLWGLFFIAAAALVVFQQLGYLEGIGIISLLITILLIPILIKSLVHVNFFGIFFTAALLLIVYMRPLNLTMLTPWPILAAALLLSIGFSIIFKKAQLFGMFGIKGHGDFSEKVDYYEESDLNFSEAFGASSKYLDGKTLRRAHIKTSFGGMKIYFNSAELNPEGAAIKFECSFSGIEIYVPNQWKVLNNIQTALGGVDEKNRSHISADSPVLTLEGTLVFGGIEIIYV
ncbi:MAG TPA: hypothetical protein DEQ02_09540 [Ruminococcaceae bacterium]|nr:hypothetical protein [Oscillospiraceae bacterium]